MSTTTLPPYLSPPPILLPPPFPPPSHLPPLLLLPHSSQSSSFSSSFTIGICHSLATMHCCLHDYHCHYCRHHSFGYCHHLVFFFLLLLLLLLLFIHFQLIYLKYFVKFGERIYVHFPCRFIDIIINEF